MSEERDKAFTSAKNWLGTAAVHTLTTEEVIAMARSWFNAGWKASNDHR